MSWTFDLPLEAHAGIVARVCDNHMVGMGRVCAFAADTIFYFF